MDRSVLTKLAFHLAVILTSVYLLVPTFMGKTTLDQIDYAAKMARDPDLPPPAIPHPWYIQYLPGSRLNLGLDLQGGIDINLKVGTKEAVLSSVQRDIPLLKQAAQTAGIEILEIRRDRKEPILKIHPGDSVTLDAVQQLVKNNVGGYEYEATRDEDGKRWLVFHLQSDKVNAIAKRSVEQAVETIRNRIDETGVKEPSIALSGSDGIDIQLPGETNVQDALAAIGTTARLEFILVDEEANEATVLQAVQAAKEALAPEVFSDDVALSDYLQDQGALTPNQRLFWHTVKKDGQELRTSPLILKGEPVLTGDDVNDAQTAPHPQTGEWHVSLEFKPQGQKIFADVTGNNVGKRFAIVLDGRIRSAPVINERINGTASISMGNQNLQEQQKDAGMLALVLRSGALPAPVTPGEIRKVGPSLGEQAIHEGVLATLVGTLMIFVFVGIYYRKSGIAAILSLMVNLLTVIASLSLLGASLTLPGICGIALTLGMAVDCNIVIYERIREEIRAGRQIRAALQTGFERASVAVFDSNITTLLAGVVLYSYGAGPLKGFAVTLMIGIFTTLYTGVYVTRALMEWFNHRAPTISI